MVTVREGPKTFTAGRLKDIGHETDDKCVVCIIGRG